MFLNIPQGTRQYSPTAKNYLGNSLTAKFEKPSQNRFVYPLNNIICEAISHFHSIHFMFITLTK